MTNKPYKGQNCATNAHGTGRQTMKNVYDRPINPQNQNHPLQASNRRPSARPDRKNSAISGRNQSKYHEKRFWVSSVNAPMNHTLRRIALTPSGVGRKQTYKPTRANAPRL